MLTMVTLCPSYSLNVVTELAIALFDESSFRGPTNKQDEENHQRVCSFTSCCIAFFVLSCPSLAMVSMTCADAGKTTSCCSQKRPTWFSLRYETVAACQCHDDRRSYGEQSCRHTVSLVSHVPSPIFSTSYNIVKHTIRNLLTSEF